TSHTVDAITPSHSSSFVAPPRTEILPLSLHDALPILTHSAAMASEILIGKTILEALNTDLVCDAINTAMRELFLQIVYGRSQTRSEEHTSELQSRFDLVCRLLLEKKKNVTTKGTR